MAYSGTLRRVALVRTDVSEEHSAPFIRVTRIAELGTTLALGYTHPLTEMRTRRFFLGVKLGLGVRVTN
jgi:hypothetical protein